MSNELSAFMVLYQLVAFSWAIAFAFLALFSFLFFCYVHGERKEKKLSKGFALFPTLLNNRQVVWLKSYVKYQEFSPGICLGGTIRPTYSGKKNRYVSWSGSGSFIPSYETIYKGNSIFGIRNHLKKDGFKGAVRRQREKEQNIKNLEKFFGKDVVDKWVKRSEEEGYHE